METFIKSDTAQAKHLHGLESLYRRWAAPLMSYSNYYVQDKEASSSIVNDIFLQLWYSRKDIRDIKAYLFRSVKNASLNHLSSRSRKPVTYMEVQQLTVLSDLSQDDADRTEEADKLVYLKKLISQLPEKRQLVFRMHRLQGFSYAEIAELLQISPRTVEDHLAKSMKFIHQHTRHFFNQALTQT